MKQTNQGNNHGKKPFTKPRVELCSMDPANIICASGTNDSKGATTESYTVQQAISFDF